MNARRTAYADQYDAATSHAHRVLDRIAEHGRTRPMPVAGNQWLAKALCRALLGGNARICPHLGASPTIAHMAVWAPGVLVCPQCVPALAPDPADETRCDRCHRHADPIHPAMASAGPVLIAFGLCEPCTQQGGSPTRTDPVAPRPTLGGGWGRELQVTGGATGCCTPALHPALHPPVAPTKTRSSTDFGHSHAQPYT